MDKLISAINDLASSDTTGALTTREAVEERYEEAKLLMQQIDFPASHGTGVSADDVLKAIRDEGLRNVTDGTGDIHKANDLADFLIDHVKTHGPSNLIG